MNSYTLLQDLPSGKTGDRYIWNGNRDLYANASNMSGPAFTEEEVRKHQALFKQEGPANTDAWQITIVRGEAEGVPISYSQGIPKVFIHEVKRLSDGAVFTVGDFVSFDPGTAINYFFRIARFRVCKGKMECIAGSHLATAFLEDLKQTELGGNPQIFKAVIYVAGPSREAIVREAKILAAEYLNSAVKGIKPIQ